MKKKKKNGCHWNLLEKYVMTFESKSLKNQVPYFVLKANNNGI